MTKTLERAARNVVVAYTRDGRVSGRLIDVLRRSLRDELPQATAEPTGRDFEKLYFSACMAAREAYGDYWWFDCPGVRWGSVPSRMRGYIYVDDRGRKATIRGLRDRKFPPAGFWSGGVIPARIEWAEAIVHDPKGAGFRRMAEINLESQDRAIHLFRINNKIMEKSSPEDYAKKLEKLIATYDEIAADLATYV